MLPNATNQPKSTIELGYMCPRGLTGPPALTLTKWLKYKQRLLLRCIHHFRSNKINNMNHIRISGTEPHQWSLAKNVVSKVEKRSTKSGKTSWSQKGWCNKLTKLQFRWILTQKIKMLSNATNQPKSTVELDYMCPRGLTGPPAVLLTKWLKYKQRLLLRCIHHFWSKKLTIWTICAFRVLNPHQWSLAKNVLSNVEKRSPKSAKTSWSQKGWCNKPTKLQFRWILTQNI